VIIRILLVQNFLQKQFRLRFEVAHNLVVLSGGDELLEVIEDVDAASRVVCVLSAFEILNLHEQGQELVKTRHNIDVDLQEGLQCLLTLCEFVHSRIVDGVAPRNAVLLGEDLTVTSNDITGVLLEQAHQTQIEFSVPFDSVAIVLDGLCQLTVLNVHSFHPEAAFLLLELIVHDFFEAHALVAEHADHAIVVALVSHDVIRAQPVVVNVQFVVNHVTRGAHLQRQVHGNVLIPQVASNVDRCAPKVISLSDKGQDLSLAEI